MHDGPCPPRASGRESAPAIRDHSKNSTQRDSPDHRDKASSGTVSPAGDSPASSRKEEAT